MKIRKFVQIASIFFFFLLIFKKNFPILEGLPANIYSKIDALMSITMAIAGGYFFIYLLPAFIILLLIAIFGNFFCFWICPFGGLFDIENGLFFRKKWKISIKTPKWLKKIRFFLLFCIIILSILTFFFKIPYFGWILDPFIILTQAIVVKGIWMFVFIVLMVINLLIPRFWCFHLCPLGALYTISGGKFKKIFKKSRTKKKIY